MLTPRAGAIIKYIVEQYISKATPVSSQSIADEAGLQVSSATIRNEVAALEKQGYIIRPHTSAGNVPADKAYRYYVDLLEKRNLPESEQHLVSHLFHQVEREVDKWLRLSATLASQLVQNMAVVTPPKAAGCKFKHMELLSLRESLTLVVLVLYGARVKEKLIHFEEGVPQADLKAVSNKLNEAYTGLTRRQIATKNEKLQLTPTEERIRSHLVEMMEAEDLQQYDEPYLDGLHFTLNQPEFAQGERVRSILELVEYRNLLKSIIPRDLTDDSVHVIIGQENEADAMRDCSVVIRQYGLPDEAMGTVGVVGPTRMHYSHTIPTVDYLSGVLSRLIAGLYGKEIEVVDKAKHPE
ncbi:MAG: heat-inducible transcriptional repressor HrcA [Chloroflexota bacterium]